MNNSRLENKDPRPTDTYVDTITESYLVLFCNRVFPGANFRYLRTRDNKHELLYYPYGGQGLQGIREALWMFVDTSLINFTVLEYNDSLNVGTWGYNPRLKYAEEVKHHVYSAYQILEGSGLIEHHVVDPLLAQSCVVLHNQEQSV